MRGSLQLEKKSNFCILECPSVKTAFPAFSRLVVLLLSRLETLFEPALNYLGASLVAQMVKHLSAMLETQV